MSRSRLLLMAALAAGGFGCAHCDTCDDFPAPCTGPNCGFQGYPIGAEVPGAPIVPIPTEPSDLVPVGPPVGGPAAEPAPSPLAPAAPAESPTAPATPAPIPDSPPMPSEDAPIPDLGTSTPMP